MERSRLRRTIDLDGEWERRDFIDEAWRWSDALRGSADSSADDGPPVKAGLSSGWRPARVPGSAIDDAWRAGEIPNPYVDRNSLAAEWIPERTWAYRRHFTIPEDGLDRSVLRFDGIDPGGTVFVDRQEVGQHRGMFLPLELELTDLGPGSHDLVVVVERAPWLPSQVSRTELAREHHSRMAYGWDFCPRLVHSGIWRSVCLDRFDARLGRPRIAIDLASDHGVANVTVECSVDGDAATLHAAVMDPLGSLVAADDATVDGDRASIGLKLERPMLWWPNGIGQAGLYRLDLRLQDAKGQSLDERSTTFGIRTVELAPTEGAASDARPYTLVMNGRPTWIRGWNWVPMDAAYGVPRPQRLHRLIELLRRANVNLLRVWGGGLIESEDFYDACDRAGIMVWQEFIQSSSGVANTPSDDPRFVELMRSEAEAIVPLRAHHPSLAIWCGGNELADPDGRPLDDRHPVLAALHDVVTRLDPTRAWLPTSPTGPRFDNSLAAVAEDPASLHDVHGPWEHQGLEEQHTLAEATTSLLHSEFGVEGMTNLPALRATVTDAQRWGADRSDPVMAHRGAWWNNEPFVQEAFGGGLSLEELERASQHLQADGLRTLIEGDRRRWPRNAGSLPWVFNEPFPNAWSNAAVDYFGVPKAAYHAVAVAYAPAAIGLSFASQALEGADRFAVNPWVVNDTDEVLRGDLLVTLHDGAGRRIDDARRPLEVAPNAVGTAREVVFGVPGDAADVLILDASFAGLSTRRLLSRTATLAPMGGLALADLAASVSVDGDRWNVRLRVTGAVPALEVRLSDDRPIGWPERPGAAYLDANLVTVLGSEARSIEVVWDDVTASDRRLRLSGWNVAERVLTGG
jgi:beta-mannosidase